MSRNAPWMLTIGLQAGIIIAIALGHPLTAWGQVCEATAIIVNGVAAIGWKRH